LKAKGTSNKVRTEYNLQDPTFKELHRVGVCATAAQFNIAVAQEDMDAIPNSYTKAQIAEETKKLEK